MPTQTTNSRAREYETIYVLNPTTSSEEASKVASRLNEVIEKLSGKVTRIDNWGNRRLAYPIAKSSRGNFTYLKYVGYSDIVAEVERNLRMLDAVVRFQTILVRPEVELSALNVNPEEVVFKAAETSGDDAEPTIEQRLGFVQDPRNRPVEGYADDDIALDVQSEDASKAAEEISDKPEGKIVEAGEKEGVN